MIAAGLVAWLFAPDASVASDVVMPHDDLAHADPVPDPSGDPPLVAVVERPTMSTSTMPSEAPSDTPSDTPSVLFLCVHNAGRSQMAAGFLRDLAGDRVRVMSGGSEPADSINPAAVRAMSEKGIDITDQSPKPWTDESVGVADVIVTMGCGDTCPLLPGKRYVDWELEDPAGKGVESVRPIRDDIERRVRDLMAELDVTPQDA